MLKSLSDELVREKIKQGEKAQIHNKYLSRLVDENKSLKRELDIVKSIFIKVIRKI